MFKAIGLGKFILFVQDELKAIICETTQWYAMAGKVGFGKPDNGSGLSVYQWVHFISVFRHVWPENGILSELNAVFTSTMEVVNFV